MAQPFSIPAVVLFNKAHFFVRGLDWTQKLDEIGIVLFRLGAVPSGVNNLADSTEQFHKERNLFLHIGDHLPWITDRNAALPVFSTHRYQESL